MIADLPNINPNARYSPSQAAKVLGVHRNTIYHWIRRGVIKATECNVRQATGKLFITGRALNRVWTATLI